MNESLSTHVELAGVIVAVFGAIVIPIWMNLRTESRRDRELTQKRHEENLQALTELKTLVALQVAPMYTWWIKKIGNGGDH